MKKSTIFLLALVYIASFLIVGIFGIAVQSYDAVYYVEKVNIEIAPNQLSGVNPKITKNMDPDTTARHYKCTVRYNYVEKASNGDIQCVVRLKAVPYPANATTSELKYVTPETSDVATVTQEENIYFNIAFKIKGAYKFKICSTDGYDAETTVQLMYY